MKKHSCGAILYTIFNNNVFIILGMEKDEWFPFKGTKDKDETSEEAAIREIYEETCGTVRVDKIELKCNYSTKRKHYHIGLVQVSISILKEFYINRAQILYKNNYSPENYAYLEKTEIKMFSLNTIHENKFHDITSIPINFYYQHLEKLQNNLRKKSPNIIPVSNTTIETSSTRLSPLMI